jgi:hypothetical protein
MADVEMKIEINGEAVFSAIQDADNLPEVLGEHTERIIGNANMLGSSFRTGIYHDHATGKTLGNTQPVYGGNVERMSSTVVGLVHPKNYAAMKDNYENNTLLKAAR